MTITCRFPSRCVSTGRVGAPVSRRRVSQPARTIMGAPGRSSRNASRPKGPSAVRYTSAPLRRRSGSGTGRAAGSVPPCWEVDHFTGVDHVLPSWIPDRGDEPAADPHRIAQGPEVDQSRGGPRWNPSKIAPASVARRCSVPSTTTSLCSCSRVADAEEALPRQASCSPEARGRVAEGDRRARLGRPARFAPGGTARLDETIDHGLGREDLAVQRAKGSGRTGTRARRRRDVLEHVGHDRLGPRGHAAGAR